MDILLPNFNLVPINVPLPQLPNLPYPPSINLSLDIDDIISAVNISLPSIALPSIPVLPQPPTLPELPSFIPAVKLQLPVLPPAPKVPNISPSLQATIKVAETIASLFCIMKGGIGLV